MHYAFLCLLRLSHDLQTFVNVLMHVDMFSGKNTSQGSGYILVRMCGSWENFVVHQRRSRRILKQVKQSCERSVNTPERFTCLKMRPKLRRSTMILSQLPHMRTRISPDPRLVYIPLNIPICMRTFQDACRSCERSVSTQNVSLV